MAPRSTTHRTQDPGDPTTRLEESLILFDRDLGALSLPALLREELSLRRLAAVQHNANPALATRLAAVEHALARGGAR